MELLFDRKTHAISYRLQVLEGRPKVLFLHGCGANHTQFAQEFDLLAKEYTVATLSLRGQGKSTRPLGNKQEDMSIKELALDVVDWLEAHNWEQSHCIACSMGGVVALELLKQQGGYFKSLLTFGTSPRLVSPRGMKAGIFLADLVLPALFPKGMARMMAYATSRNKDAQKRLTEDFQVAYQKRRTLYDLRCFLANYDYTEVLRGSAIPVLLLQGENDTAINREIEKLWPRLQENPMITREYLQNAGHVANYDAPLAFYGRLTSFLKAQEA